MVKSEKILTLFVDQDSYQILHYEDLTKKSLLLAQKMSTHNFSAIFYPHEAQYIAALLSAQFDGRIPTFECNISMDDFEEEPSQTTDDSLGEKFDPTFALEGRHIAVVTGINYSGKSLTRIDEYFQTKRVASVWYGSLYEHPQTQFPAHEVLSYSRARIVFPWELETDKIIPLNVSFQE